MRLLLLLKYLTFIKASCIAFYCLKTEQCLVLECRQRVQGAQSSGPTENIETACDAGMLLQRGTERTDSHGAVSDFAAS